MQKATLGALGAFVSMALLTTAITPALAAEDSPTPQATIAPNSGALPNQTVVPVEGAQGNVNNDAQAESDVGQPEMDEETPTQQATVAAEAESDVNPQAEQNQSPTAEPLEEAATDGAAQTSEGPTGAATAPQAAREGDQAEPAQVFPQAQGGTVVADNQYGVGALKIYDAAGKRFNLCTGMLLTRSLESKWVLTARQCFLNKADYNKTKPTAAVSPKQVTFHLNQNATGTGIRATKLILDPNSDLALVVLSQQISTMNFGGPSFEEIERGHQVSTYGYGNDPRDPWKNPVRRKTTHTFTDFATLQGQKCGYNLLATRGTMQHQPGDIGGPALDSQGGILGILTHRQLNVFTSPGGKRYAADAPDTGTSYWIPPSTIRIFLLNSQKESGLIDGSDVGILNPSCDKVQKRQVVSVLASSDSSRLWSASVHNGTVQYHYPGGAEKRVAELGKPVVFKLRSCYQSQTNCVIEQSYLLPKGWKVQNALESGAAIPKEKITASYNTAWGTNLKAIKLPTYHEPWGNYFTHRLNGFNRVETSVRAFKETEFTKNAVLVSGANFADAVVAGPLAAKYDTGILLTTSKGSLESQVLSALTQGKVKNVLIVGGPGAVNKAKEDQLTKLGIAVTRLGGNDRYLTSSAVAQHLRSKGATSHVFVADGSGFADALAAGAAAGAQNGYILLCRTSTVGGKVVDATSSEVKKYFRADKTTVAVGRKAAVATESWGKSVAVVGNDRYETAAILALGYGKRQKVIVASGVDFADALVASAVAVKEKGSLILLPQAGQSVYSLNAIRALDPASITIVGGYKAVPNAVMELHNSRAGRYYP
ncbi:cell wall-binding repeat-containing protein [Buchananella felis]|uniref:cell wall-binding repeat-containing protein n=1 Tax=Buchananella felis TaxID=3231492 RepID=UPI003528604E